MLTCLYRVWAVANLGSVANLRSGGHDHSRRRRSYELDWLANGIGSGESGTGAGSSGISSWKPSVADLDELNATVKARVVGVRDGAIGGIGNRRLEMLSRIGHGSVAVVGHLESVGRVSFVMVIGVVVRNE